MAKSVIFFNLKLVISILGDNIGAVRHFSNRHTIDMVYGFFFFLFVGFVDDKLRKSVERDTARRTYSQ